MELVGDYSEFAQNEEKQTNSARTCYSPNLKIDEPARLELNLDITKSEHHSTLGHQYVNLKMKTSRLHTLFLYAQPYYVADERSFRYTKPGPKTFYDFGDQVLKEHNRVCYEFYWKIYEEVKESLRGDVEKVFRSNSESKLSKLSFELARMVLPFSTKTQKWHTVNAEVLLQHCSFIPKEIKCHQEYIDQLFSKVLSHSPTANSYIRTRVPESSSEFFRSEDFYSGHHFNILNCGNKFSTYYDDENILTDVRDEILGCEKISSLSRYSSLGNKLAMKRVSGSYVMSASCLAQLIRHRPFSLSYKFLNNSFYEDKFLDESKSYTEFLDYVKDTLENNKNHELSYYFRPLGNNLYVHFNVSCFDLINFFKKRLCFNAQSEVYKFSEFLIQGFKKGGDPTVIDHIYAPPCSHNFRSGKKPTCPEGTRYCRIPVWKLEDRMSGRKF
jgi:thymidylate synthase ThyX